MASDLTMTIVLWDYKPVSDGGYLTIKFDSTSGISTVEITNATYT